MSTKNKKIAYYLAAFLVVLMLVCTCLLGNTFARYVSSSSGSATATVADWEVSASGELHGKTTYEMTSGSISPSKDGNGSGTPTNSTTPVLLAKISIGNETDVNVTLTISATDVDYVYSGSSISSWGSGTYDGEDGSTPQKTEVAAALTIALYYTTTEVIAAGSSLTIDEVTGTSGATKLTSSGVNTTWNVGDSAVTYYVYGWVTWTTDYSTYGNTNSEGIYVADALDVWIAQNVDSLSTTITAQAVQATDVK